MSNFPLFLFRQKKFIFYSSSKFLAILIFLVPSGNFSNPISLFEPMLLEKSSNFLFPELLIDKCWLAAVEKEFPESLTFSLIGFIFYVFPKKIFGLASSGPLI